MNKRQVVTLGPKGTFSEDAAKIISLRTTRKIMFLSSWDAVAQNVADEETNVGVMAYRNTLSGKVMQSIAAMKKHNLKTIYNVKVPIQIAIGEYPGNTDRDAVYSFPNALAQCSDYLSKNYPYIKRIHSDSTSAAAETVSRNKSGLAVAKLETLVANGLTIIEEDITNKGSIENVTEFYVVRK